MSTLKEATQADTSGYLPVEAPLKPSLDTTQSSLEPVYNTFLRCPLPPVTATSDTLRQFYIKGQVPQFRILTAGNTPYSNGGSGGGTIILQSPTSGSGGGNPPTPPAQGNAVSGSITTPSLNVGDVFVSNVVTSESFQLLSIATNAPARVELYSTGSAQSGDLSRGLDIPPPAGTYQGIICDVALDTSPFKWYFEGGVVGANADVPQSGTTYMTITNIGNGSASIAVTYVYVPLEA